MVGLLKKRQFKFKNYRIMNQYYKRKIISKERSKAKVETVDIVCESSWFQSKGNLNL